MFRLSRVVTTVNIYGDPNRSFKRQKLSIRQSVRRTGCIDKDCISNSKSTEKDILEEGNEDSQMDEDSEEEGSEYEDNSSNSSIGSFNTQNNVVDKENQDSDNSMESVSLEDNEFNDIKITNYKSWKVFYAME